ncbi:sigma-54-dependent Fis family transcriptional regulator [Streptomyces sp. NPDC091280]|uniref:sigma-54-dependent Fis family transcriptional regulator n=1 Tax=Streptomyces sp. NPDC091280 TaxID=3365984 RepID=UPI00381AA835
MSGTTLRPEIASSWRRCSMSGLGPSKPDLRVEPDLVDRRSRLMASAEPVLAQLGEQLADASFCVVLADREARIVDVPVGARSMRNRLAEYGAVAGGVFMEETTGTNSIATVYELRRGLAVHAEEHYLESFKQFSCYGHPITHPVTRRLEGVLDISCLSKDASPLLRPFLARAAHDIEEQLLRTARHAEQRMLAAFQAATAGRNHPVLVLGESVVLANPAAMELVEPVDHHRLRELAADRAEPDGPVHEPASVELSSGRTVAVRVSALMPGTDGVLFEFQDPQDAACPVVGRGRARVRRSRPVSSTPPLPGTAVYVGGQPGTGRTTAARALTVTRDGSPGRIAVLDSTETAAVGEAAWLGSLEAAVADTPDLLLVEDVHLLPEPCAVRLRRVMERADVWVVLTGPPLADLTGYALVLAADCPAHIGLPALRDRIDDLPELVRAMLEDRGAGDRVRFTPAALATLSGHSWPGNLRELNTVVRTAVARRSAGDIAPGDLPAGYQVSPRLRRMTPLERAEHNVITAALREHDGNKLRAAQQLGISRTTLYSRMRALGIGV